MQSNFQCRYKQRGMSATAVLFVLVVIGFVATATVKLGPAYIDNQKVTSALDSLKEEYASKDLNDISDKRIADSLKKRLQVNLVAQVIMGAVTVTRVKGDVFVSVNYEIRNNFMSNVDAVIVFNNEVNLAR